jgi:hypothetical protein
MRQRGPKRPQIVLGGDAGCKKTPPEAILERPAAYRGRLNSARLIAADSDRQQQRPIFEFHTSSHSALRISSAFNTASFITGDILFGHEIDASHRSSGTILVSV